MPNWTSNKIIAPGIENMDIYSEINGNKEFDFNKLIPMPDYVRDTISPVRTKSVLCYLFTEYSEAEARSLIERTDISVDPELLSKTSKEIIELTSEPQKLGYGKNEKNISAYDLGKNYVMSKAKTGYWDWYAWSNAKWGTKWNASETNISRDELTFDTPWSCPSPIFKALAEKYPGVEFTAEINYEDELFQTLIIHFSDKEWKEEWLKPALSFEVWALGYDINDRADDFEKLLYSSDDLNAALEYMENLRQNSSENLGMIFEGAKPDTHHAVVRLEVVDTDEKEDYSWCVDFFDEETFDNPNYSKT